MNIGHRLIDAGFAAGLVDPPRFFQRLYRYDWYGDTLVDWARESRKSPDTRVLEIGCGPGDLSTALAKDGGEVQGVDRSEKMIRHAKRRFFGAANLAFSVGDATELALPDGAFDVVISASLINVVPEPLNMLKEMERVTKSGGRVSVLFPTPEFTRALAVSLAKARALSMGSAAGMRVWAGAARKLPISQVETWFEAAGIGEVNRNLHLDGALASVSGTAQKSYAQDLAHKTN